MQHSIVHRPFSLLLFVLSLGVSGCGPSLKTEDLGTVEMKVPKLPGSDGPYPIPELEPAADSAAESTSKPADLVPKPPAQDTSEVKK